MYRPFIIGEKLYLRALEEADLVKNYFDWLNDEEVTKFLDSGYFPNTTDVMEEYYCNVVPSRNNIILAIVDKEVDEHIGNIRLGTIDWINRTAPLGVMIGDKEFWGKGYGTEAIRLVLDYAFRRLNLHKVYAGIVAIHYSSIKAFEKAGFEVEGRAKSNFFLGGEYYDSLHLGVLSSDFLERSNHLSRLTASKQHQGRTGKEGEKCVY